MTDAKENYHTVAVLVENEFGVLARVASLFSGKGYNIDSLSVSPTLDPTVSRMTIVTHGSDLIIQQIVKQLAKLINVLRVEDFTEERYLNREMILVKVAAGKKHRSALEKLVTRFDGKILEDGAKSLLLEFNGEPARLGGLLEQLRALGILEFVRTGAVAIHRGETIFTS